MNDQQSLFDLEDQIAFRTKLRALRQAISDAEEACQDVRSRYATARSKLSECRLKLEEFLKADAIPLPLFDRSVPEAIARAAEAMPATTVHVSLLTPVVARLPDVPPRALLVADITVEGFTARLIYRADGWHQLLADINAFGTWHDADRLEPHSPTVEQIAQATEQAIGFPTACTDHWPEEDGQHGVMVFELSASNREKWRCVGLSDLSQRQRSLLFSLPGGSVDCLGELVWWFSQGNTLEQIPAIEPAEVPLLDGALLDLWVKRTEQGGNGEPPPWPILAPKVEVTAPSPLADLDSPQAVIGQINDALLAALYARDSADLSWRHLIQYGATDETIRATLASEWSMPVSGSSHGGWYARGGKGAGFWHGVQGPVGKATFTGKALIARVRKVLSIGSRSDRAAGQKGGKA